MREARQAYFTDSGLSEEAYTSRWVRLGRGPVPLGFPNFAARRRAVALHDLHHVATGYDTSWTGEAEIAAWELRAGCGRYWAAWVLNAGAAGLGLVIAPRRTAQAWRRGRQSRTLYRVLPGGITDEVLDLPMSQLRRILGLAPDESTADGMGPAAEERRAEAELDPASSARA